MPRSILHRVATTVVITLTVLICFAAIGKDVIFTLYKTSQMQIGADNAAFYAAILLVIAGGYENEARPVSATVGFVDYLNGTHVIANKPPKIGKGITSPAVEVIGSQTQIVSLVALLGRVVDRQANWSREMG